MIDLWKRLQFLVWFARGDLLDAQHLPASAAVAASVALLTGIGLAAFALADGYEFVRMMELEEKHPLALCLWIGDSHGGAALDDNTVGKLTARLSALPGPPHIVPFRERTLDWYTLQSQPDRPQSAQRVPNQNGCLCDPEMDLLLKSLPLREDSPGAAAVGDSWVIVSQFLLAKLTAGARELPRQLRVQDVQSEPIEVAVAGVSKEERLPQDYDFILSVPADRRLRTMPVEGDMWDVLVGPIPEKWHDPANLPPEAAKALDQFADTSGLQRLCQRTDPQKAKTLPKDRGGRPAWRLELASKLEPRAFSDWQTYVRILVNTLKENGIAFNPPLAIQDIKLVASPEDKPPYRARVFVKQVRHLREVERAADALHLPVLDRDVIRQMEALDDSVNNARNVGRVLLGLFAFVALCNILVTQSLNARIKTAQIGMLKAMGISRPLLLGVYFAETVILWTAGLVAGAVLGVVLGKWGARMMAETAIQQAAAFNPSAELISLVVVLSALFCLVGVLLPGCASLWHSPAKMLAGD